MGLFDRFLGAIRLNDDLDDDEDYTEDEDFDEDEDDDFEEDQPKKRFWRLFSGQSHDDYDEDDEDSEDDEDEDEDEDLTTGKRSFSLFGSRKSSRKDYDEEEDDGEYDEEEDEEQEIKSRSRKSASARREKKERVYSEPSSGQKSTRSAYASSSYSAYDQSASAYTYAGNAVGQTTYSTNYDRNKYAGTTGASSSSRSGRSDKKKRNTGFESRVQVIRPESMEDTQDIAETLMANSTVVLNLEGIDVDTAQRIIDFSCGACYSLHGGLQKVSTYFYILTPENVPISGDFTSILNGDFNFPSMRSQY